MDDQILFSKSQVDALLAKWRQADQGLTFEEFKDTAQPTIGCNGAVAVPWAGMVLCIERDGYTHS